MDLFADIEPHTGLETLAPGAVVLRGYVLDIQHELIEAVNAITAQSPFRHLVTPGGHTMSVAMTNTGRLGWVSDRSGYRYDAIDPQTQAPWPAMPEVFADLATRAASAGGFADFHPDACLVNRYEPGARLTLHQDRDEGNYAYPIVSVSLGVPAVFLFGGDKRTDKQQRVPLVHGDVVVWGGPSRLRYHGVQPIKAAQHPLLGALRINLTFRKAS